MAFIVRTSRALSRPAPSTKVLPAEEVWTLRERDEIIAEALRRRDEILQQAQADHESEKARGYAEGTEQARLSQAGQMMEVVARTAAYFTRVEQRMVDLVLGGVQVVVESFDDREKVAALVTRALAEVRSQKHIMLRVHPDHVAGLRERVDQLTFAYPAIECVDVVSDPRLARDALAVETDIGIVEASVSGQLEALTKAFRNAFDDRP